MQHVSTPYDDVFRTLVNDCSELVIPVVNEIFDENYTGEERIRFLPNEHFINGQDAVTKEKVTDTCFEIDGNISKKYHLECQSTPDGSMLIRMFEYDSQIALDYGEVVNYVLTVTFPHSAVLYLRHTFNTPDVMTVEINTPDGSITYKIPVVKLQQYTIDEIFEKQLLFMVPFYIFSYEKQFQYYESSEEKINEMNQQYLKIRKRLEERCEQNIISEYVKCTLLDLSRKVVDHIAANYKNIREGVKSAMGGKVLEYEAKTILNEGISIGKIEGYVELIRDGLLSLEEAAKRLEMNQEDIKKYL